MEQRILELIVETEKSNKNLKQVRDQLLDVNDNLEDINSGSKKAFKGVEKSINNSAKATKGLGKTLTSVGTLFKASGIFFIAQKVMEGLQSAFSENQRVVDAFSIASRAATTVINDFVNFVINNFGSVTARFKEVFENPVQSLKDFGNAIVDNVIERFNSAISVLGSLASGFIKFTRGDLPGAAAELKNAGKEMVDVITGVDGSVEKASEKVSDLTKAASDYGKQVIKNSKNLVFAEKEAQLAEARNVGLKESFDVQAELQRQIRDDTSKSIEDRIAANNRLGEVLKEQSDLMKEEAQNVVNAAQARFNLTGKLEDEVALIQAKNELAAVEATVTGFVSEQLVNENALRQEKLELMNELKLIGESEFERQRLEAEIEREEAIAKIEREVSDEETKNELLAAARQRYSDQIAEIDQSEADAKDKARQEEIAADLAATEAKIGFAKGALGALQGLAKEGSASAKALAVGQTILDAYKSINAVFANAAANPSTILFPGYPFVQAAIAGVNAFATVKKIMAVNPEKPSGGSVAAPAGRSGGASVQSQAPAFNVVGASPENQLASAIGDREEKPVKAFVVSSEVSNAQALDRNIIESASIG